MRSIWTMSLAAEALLWTMPLAAQGPAWSGGYPCGAHMMGWHGGWGGMILGPLFLLLVLLAIGAVIVLVALRRFGTEPRGPSSAPSKPPLDILMERFARGEIDKEEFEERRRVLAEAGGTQ